MFEGNEEARAAELIGRLEAGEDVAVVTDGEVPSISDPGYRVVRLAADRGLDVRVIPGPSAAIAALVASGLPTDRFAFEGFLPRRPGDRTRRLAELCTTCGRSSSSSRRGASARCCTRSSRRSGIGASLSAGS